MTRVSYEATARNSVERPSSDAHRSSISSRPTYPENYSFPASRLGPQRTSYTAQKLKLLPDEPLPNDDNNTRDVYSQASRIKEKPARKDAERLGKAHRTMLPRVTAYCSASSYNMKDLTRYLTSLKDHKTSPKLFDECLYTPYSYLSSVDLTDDGVESSHGMSARLIRLDDEGGEIDVEQTDLCDVFLFEYGVVVLWGFTANEERRFLQDISRFENEKLAEEDVQVEEFNYYVTQSYQPRVSTLEIQETPLTK